MSERRFFSLRKTGSHVTFQLPNLNFVSLFANEMKLQNNYSKMGLKIFRRKELNLEMSYKMGLMLKKANPARRAWRQVVPFFGGKLQPLASKGAQEVLGGRCLSPHKCLDSTSTESTGKTASWKSCDTPDHQRDSLNIFEDNREMWARAIRDSRRLPQSTQFSNNHIMVNNERAKRCVPALKRNCALDALARWHAENMAAADKVFHANETELLSRLERETELLGENVGRGESIQSIHTQMMKNKADIYNMADRRYREMGMATARGVNGDLFLCQIFHR